MDLSGGISGNHGGTKSIQTPCDYTRVSPLNAHDYDENDEEEESPATRFDVNSNSSKSRRIREDERSFLRSRVWAGSGLIAGIVAVLFAILVPSIALAFVKHVWGYLKKPVDKQQCSCSRQIWCDTNTFTSTAPGTRSNCGGGRWAGLSCFTSRSSPLCFSCFRSACAGPWESSTFLPCTRIFMLGGTLGTIFFSATELVSTTVAVRYFDRRRPLPPLPLLVITNIALFHVGSSVWDQFFINIFRGEGQLHQILRDIPLMATDLLQIGVSLGELRSWARRHGRTTTAVITDKFHVTMTLGMTLFMLFLVSLFPS